MGQHQSLANDKGTELSLRVAINKLIESCLSNPQSTDRMPGNETMKNQIEEKNNSSELDSTEASAKSSSEEKTIDDEKGSKNVSEKSMSSAQSISSLLEMHIRDMIVNCENEEDLDKPKEISQSPTLRTSTSSAVSCSTNSDNTSTETTHSSVSSAISSSVTSGLRASGISSVPLQTLVDKVLDNSLGDPSVYKPIEAKIPSENTKSNGNNDNKTKNNGSYEIAAESAKAVSEKVTRCVEKNQINNEIPSVRPGDICLMAHIEKALERNFAQMYEAEAESEKKEPVKISSQADSKDTSNNNSQVTIVTQSDSAVSGEISTIRSKKESIVPVTNTRQTYVTNPDGTISVQDIVDRIFSQTEMISKLLTPGTTPATSKSPTRPKDKISTPSVISQQSYERNIVKTLNSLPADPPPRTIPRSSPQQPMKHYNSVDAYNQSKSRDDYIKKRNMGPTPSHLNELPDKHLQYNQSRYKEPTPYNNTSYIQPDTHTDPYMDHRVLSEVQRQAVVRENMMMLARYPYSMPITPNVDPSLQPPHPLLRYCPPGPLMQQRLPPPLLRVDAVNDSSACSPIPHPYNKSCPCISCSSQRSHIEELKHSPKQHNMLLSSNSLLSPSGGSPHYQSRLSPHTKDIRNLSPHSPQQYGCHPSAFTRVKDSLPERETTLRIYHEDVSSTKSRMDNGIDMLYRDRKSIEGYRQSMDPMCSKSKHHSSVQISHPSSRSDVEVKPLPYGMKYGYADLDSQALSEQPLDLSKKKTHQNQQHHREHDRDFHQRLSKSHPPEHHHDRQLVRVSNTHVPHLPHTYVESEMIPASSDRAAPARINATQYNNNHSSRQQTSAAMTPGMMPDKLGSPGGIRPQLHPLPSPTLSTSYANRAASQSPQISNHLSPNDKSPDFDRSSIHVTEGNLSRPSSQSSSSPSDQDKDRRGSISRHEPVQNIIGTHPPSDILYLICRLCRQTYGSPYGFRKHFRNQHGFEPKAEHTVVHTISATKNAMQHIPGVPNEIHSPVAFRPMADGTIFESVDSPKVRERAASESKLLNSASVPETDRPSSSRSAECRQNVVMKGESVDDTKCLKCDQCKQTFQLNDFGSYKRHCRQHNQTRTIGPFHCQMCSCSFQEPHLLDEHLLKHESESFICKYCKIPYAHKMYLDEHMKTVHGTDSVVNINSCKYCHLTFVDYKELLIHIQSIHGTHLEQGAIEKRFQKKNEDSKVSSHVDIMEADQMTTLSCPDSSSDNVKEKVRSSTSSSPYSDSKKSVSGEASKPEGSGSSNENSQDPLFSLDNNETGVEHFYKHKKFFGHRKRKESLDSTSIPAKCSRNNSECIKSDSEFVDNSVSCSSSTNMSEQDKDCDSSIVNRDSNQKDFESDSSSDQLNSLNKQEARHQMPFVWDRITRSQAGKNIRPPDYMA